MLGSPGRATCPDCGRDVLPGRWCNRCGAALERPAADAPSGRRWGLAILAALVGLAGVGTVATTLADDDGPAPTAAEVVDDTPVVLAEDPPAPPAPTPTPTRRPTVPVTPAGERVDVICSDLKVRSVPLAAVATDEPGELVELANGTCVVMGPNGAVAP